MGPFLLAGHQFTEDFGQAYSTSKLRNLFLQIFTNLSQEGSINTVSTI